MSPFNNVEVFLPDPHKRKFIWKNVDVRNDDFVSVGVTVLVDVEPSSVDYSKMQKKIT